MVKPVLEILAGIPTVVYGFFAALTVAPFDPRRRRKRSGSTSPRKARWPPALVMGIMIIPFVSSLSDDVINAVPQALRDGSYAPGRHQVRDDPPGRASRRLPGIVGAVLLAVSPRHRRDHDRGHGRRPAANLTANPLEAVTTVTVQIVTLLVGDQEFDSPKTLSAFALGLVLFCVTLALNVVALRIVRKIPRTV